MDPTVGAIREWLGTLPEGIAELEVTRDAPSEGMALLDISPRRRPDAAAIWILLTGDSHDITYLFHGVPWWVGRVLDTSAAWLVQSVLQPDGGV